MDISSRRRAPLRGPPGRSLAAGPAKGANIFRVFIDRVGNYGADGKAAAIGGERSLVVVVPVKHPQNVAAQRALVPT